VHYFRTPTVDTTNIDTQRQWLRVRHPALEYRRRCVTDGRCSLLTSCFLSFSHHPFLSQVLTRWGGALLELAHFKQGPEAGAYTRTLLSSTQALCMG
jgi:hypothetical protein